MDALFYLKDRNLSMSDLHNTFVEANHNKEKGDLQGFKKDLLMLIKLKRVTKPSPESLDFTNPQSDRLKTLVDQQRSLQDQLV